MWHALIIIAILYILSGIDDLLIDILYWARFFKRKTNHYPPLTYQDLTSIPEKKIALIVPCWMESSNIQPMLHYNLEVIDYGNYDVFIGAYPNDIDTLKVIKHLQKKYNNLFLVISPKLGPTSKAQNLNSVYFYILEHEKKIHMTYEIFVMHDVEDIIHPLSLKLYNYLIPKKDMIQVPIFPFPIKSRYVTHWTYCDEFAEIHTKDLIIREALFGFVPSAGVGTALGLKAMELLLQKYNGVPFNDKSLVEDYDMAYQLCLSEAKEIFLIQHETRVKLKKKWFLWGKKEPKLVKEYVSTYSLFPDKYLAAVVQKSRWSYGIVIQQWHIHGWRGSILIKLVLLHDRKSIISNFINGFGYFVFLYWMFIYLYQRTIDSDITILPYYFEVQPWVWTLVIICTVLMLNRLFQRAIASYRVYGILPAILSIPRTIYANIINLNAITRACKIHWKSGLKKAKKKPVAWDKTANRFPHIDHLTDYKRKFGDVLLDGMLVKPNDLKKALREQAKSGRPIGEILQASNHLSPQQVVEVLARLYHLPIVSVTKDQILPANKLSIISKETYQWMLANKLFPIDYDGMTLTVIIDNPVNQDLRNELIYERTSSCLIRFVLNFHQESDSGLS